LWTSKVKCAVDAGEQDTVRLGVAGHHRQLGHLEAAVDLKPHDGCGGRLRRLCLQRQPH
jgi:hypothetical protein